MLIPVFAVEASEVPSEPNAYIDHTRLKAHLDHPGRSAAALAKEMKTSIASVRRMMKGTQQITKEDAIRIFLYLDCALFPGTREAKPKRVSLKLPKEHDLIEYRGNAMSETFRPGEQLVIDRADRTPSPPGLFLLDMSIGEEVRRVEVIIGSRPLVARVSTDHPAYPDYEIAVADLRVAGRVVGSFVKH